MKLMSLFRRRTALKASRPQRALEAVSKAASMFEEEETPLIRVGETVQTQLRYTREQIVQFARLTGDANPLHHDRQAAERASFGEIIASGQQTASQMMGVVASHFSRSADGVPREALLLNFNFSFKVPVFAEQDIHIEWRVSDVQRNQRRGGYVGHVDGTASVAGRPCVIGRGTVLVTRRQGEAAVPSHG
jgi:acyl dehydratase